MPALLPNVGWSRGQRGARGYSLLLLAGALFRCASSFPTSLPFSVCEKTKYAKATEGRCPTGWLLATMDADPQDVKLHVTLRHEMKPPLTSKRKRPQREALVQYNQSESYQSHLAEMSRKLTKLESDHSSILRRNRENEERMRMEINNIKKKLADAVSGASELEEEVYRRIEKEKLLQAEIEALKQNLAEAETNTRPFSQTGKSQPGEKETALQQEVDALRHELSETRAEASLKNEYQRELEVIRESELKLNKKVEILQTKLLDAEAMVLDLKKELEQKSAEAKSNMKTETMTPINGLGQSNARPDVTVLIGEDTAISKRQLQGERTTPPVPDEEGGKAMPPILQPRDVSDQVTKAALLKLRENDVSTDKDLAAIMKMAPKSTRTDLTALNSAGSGEAATLTATGFKGGELDEQNNQDKAFIVSPLKFDGPLSLAGSIPVKNVVLGVFDGHSINGEVVAEHAVQNMPKILFSKLDELSLLAKEGQWSDAMCVDWTKQVLIDSFVDVHESGRRELSLQSGGCTASVVLQLGEKVYIANVGDSRSIIATYSEASGDIQVVYVTREDTPDLNEERERIEQMGGKIGEIEGQSRVLSMDNEGNLRSAHAVSRSIGDWELEKAGIIPTPIVGVVDLKEIAKPGNNVEVFAVSATDGLFDVVEYSDILIEVVEGLYVSDAPHLFTSLENLLTQAKDGWNDLYGEEYRDDITVSASKLPI